MAAVHKIYSTLAELSETLQALNDSPTDIKSLSSPAKLKLRRSLLNGIKALESFERSLDPIRQPETVFDPSAPAVVGRLIGDTLLEQPRHPLDALARFYGSGVYAIYYRGEFSAYLPISGKEIPLYVGKADPQTPTAQVPSEQGVTLHKRLGEHAKSIRAATNLNLNDFECRYLVVKSAWQKTSEEYLINLLQPVWNNEMRICFGFGKHGDSPETRGNKRSPWDTLHPGRPWATKEGNVAGVMDPSTIQQHIAKHFEMVLPRLGERFGL